MGFIGVEWDHPWIYWWPPFGDTAWAGFFGSDSVYFWSSCHKGNKQPLIDHIDHFKGWLKYFEVLWSTLKYFEVLWSTLKYWLLISYLQGHPRPLSWPTWSPRSAVRLSQMAVDAVACSKNGWERPQVSLRFPKSSFFFWWKEHETIVGSVGWSMIRLKQWSLQVSSDAAALQLGDLHRGTGGPIFNDFHGFFDQRPVPKKIIGPSQYLPVLLLLLFLPQSVICWNCSFILHVSTILFCSFRFFGFCLDRSHFGLPMAQLVFRSSFATTWFQRLREISRTYCISVTWLAKEQNMDLSWDKGINLPGRPISEFVTVFVLECMFISVNLP